jgi:hypothetical protein
VGKAVAGDGELELSESLSVGLPTCGCAAGRGNLLAQRVSQFAVSQRNRYMATSIGMRGPR